LSKIRIYEDGVVPPQSRVTVAGLVLISSARIVNVPNWLTRHRMVKTWVQILHSLVDNSSSNMSLMIVNDSEEEYLCKKSEVITTMIPDPMGLEGWYGEDQTAQVQREAPLDFIGPIPSPSGKVKIPVSPNPKVKEEVTVIIIPELSIRWESTSPDVPSIFAGPDEYFKEVTFPNTNERNPVVMQSIVSDHIIKPVNNCVIKGIKVEGGKTKKHRAVYIDLTNSSSESETDSNNVSIILDTPFFNAKVKKKSRFSPAQSSSTDTLSPISFSSGHDTDALHSSSLNSDNKDNVDSCSWDSNGAVACFSCSNLSFSNCCLFTNMPKNRSRGKKTVSKAKTRAVLRSEATAKKHADNRTFSCPTCAHTVTRARNLRYHMCEMHNLWCETLRQSISFPQPDSVFRTPTAEEYEVYGHGKPFPAAKVPERHVHNRVVYDDVSEASNVPTTINVGVDNTDVPYDGFRSYPAAAGSATQATIDEVVVRAIEVGPLSFSLPLNDVHPLHTATQTDQSYGFSDFVLDQIQHRGVRPYRGRCEAYYLDYLISCPVMTRPC